MTKAKTALDKIETGDYLVCSHGWLYEVRRAEPGNIFCVRLGAGVGYWVDPMTGTEAFSDLVFEPAPQDRIDDWEARKAKWEGAEEWPL